MKIISWNVNSIRIRKEQLFDLLYKEDPRFRLFARDQII